MIENRFSKSTPTIRVFTRTLNLAIFVFFIAVLLPHSTAFAAKIRTDCFSLVLGGDWKEAGLRGGDKMVYLSRNAIYARISCDPNSIPPADSALFREYALNRLPIVETEAIARYDASVALIDKTVDTTDTEVRFRYFWRGADRTIYSSRGTLRGGKLLVVTIRSVDLEDAKHEELMTSVLKAIKW